MNVIVASNSFEDRAQLALAPVIANKEVARVGAYAMLCIADVVVISMSFIVANYFYLGNLTDEGHGLIVAGVMSPIYVLIAALTGAYNGQTIESARHSVFRALNALVAAAAAVMFIAYFLKAGSDFSRAAFGIGALCSLVGLPLARYSLSGVALKLVGGTPYSTIVIRDGVAYQPCPHDVVVTPEEIGFDPTTQDAAHYNALAHAAANADRLIIACKPERYAIWSSVLKCMATDGEIIMAEQDELEIIGLSQHGDHRTMLIAIGPLHLMQRIIKRAFDLVCSISGLILLSPLLLGTAIAIRMESEGPVFFRQYRIGRDNKLFLIYKFRSMFADKCDATASVLTARGDNRVTKVGEFIRRTSIDELPQLINVLKGEMSIVGPRPHATSAKAANLLYWDVDPRYRHRHAVKPGLTGLAQIRGFRGATDRTEDLTNRLSADLEYVVSWSLWKDIWIVLQTLRVIRHDNAF